MPNFRSRYAHPTTAFGRSETSALPMRPTAARHTAVSRVQTAGVIRRAAVQRGEMADRTRPVPALHRGGKRSFSLPRTAAFLTISRLTNLKTRRYAEA